VNYLLAPRHKKAPRSCSRLLYSRVSTWKSTKELQ